MVCAVSDAIDAAIAGEAGVVSGPTACGLHLNRALLQRLATSERRPGKTGSARIAGSGELPLPFSHQLLEVLLVDAFSILISVPIPKILYTYDHSSLLREHFPCIQTNP